MASKMYGQLPKVLAQGEVKFIADTIKVMLVSSAYTPNQDSHVYLDAVRANEVTGTGYTAGGKALTGKTLTYDASTNVTKFDADDTSWTASSITARYAVVYDDAGATDATKPLIAYYDFTTDRASSQGELVVRWSTDGLASITAA